MISAPVECLQAALGIRVSTIMLIIYTGTGQVIVAASVTQKMLIAQPQKHVIYLTDRVHLLYQQAALFSSQLGRPVER
jgi:type I site-specific restriction endonuclease